MGIIEGIESYTLTKLKRPPMVRFALTDLMSLRVELAPLQALVASRRRVGTGI